MKHLLQGGITSWNEQERLPRSPATRWKSAGSAIGGVIGLAAALIGLTATEKKRSESGEYAPKLLRVISAADALKN